MWTSEGVTLSESGENSPACFITLNSQQLDNEVHPCHPLRRSLLVRAGCGGRVGPSGRYSAPRRDGRRVRDASIVRIISRRRRPRRASRVASTSMPDAHRPVADLGATRSRPRDRSPRTRRPPLAARVGPAASRRPRPTSSSAADAAASSPLSPRATTRTEASCSSGCSASIRRGSPSRTTSSSAP